MQNRNLIVASQTNRNPCNRRDKPVSRDNVNRSERFQEERWNYERTDFGPTDPRECSLNHPDLKPMLIDQDFTKMSTTTEQFSYVLELVALIHVYMELGLPLPAALRAAEADLL